jgi:acyl carrier protein
MDESIHGYHIHVSTYDVVALAWTELLGIGEIRPTDGFFELGGDSLLGVVMIERIEQELGIEFPLEDFFRDDTLAGTVSVCVARMAHDRAD